VEAQDEAAKIEKSSSPPKHLFRRPGGALRLPSPTALWISLPAPALWIRVSLRHPLPQTLLPTTLSANPLQRRLFGLHDLHRLVPRVRPRRLRQPSPAASEVPRSE
jgi:hypothetical protein